MSKVEDAGAAAPEDAAEDHAAVRNLWDRDPAPWEALAAREATPYFVIDADHVRRRIAHVRGAIGAPAQVYFAVKSNPNLGLLRSLRGHADGFDISSAGELDQALQAGLDPAAFSFAGPAKSDAELEAAIAAGVGCISAESPREIEACGRIAARLGRRAGLLLRVNPRLATRGYGLKMGGRAVQFGIDEDALPHAAETLRAAGRHVECRGIHAYVGSQCFDAEGVAEATRNALRIAGDVACMTGAPPTRVNVGGGFGVGHAEVPRELDVMALAAALRADLAAFDAAQRGECRVIFELGRYLAAEAGVYVARVVDVKVSRGKVFVACDGGLHHQLAAAGTFGAALRSNFPLRNLTRPGAEPVACNVAGPSCNPTDLLGVDCTLPTPQPGDLLGVLMSGSYALTASPLLFLGRDTPAEWVRRSSAGPGSQAGGAHDARELVVGRRRMRITEFN